MNAQQNACAVTPHTSHSYAVPIDDMFQRHCCSAAVQLLQERDAELERADQVLVGLREAATARDAALAEARRGLAAKEAALRDKEARSGGCFAASVIMCTDGGIRQQQQMRQAATGAATLLAVTRLELASSRPCIAKLLIIRAQPVHVHAHVQCLSHSPLPRRVAALEDRQKQLVELCERQVADARAARDEEVARLRQVATAAQGEAAREKAEVIAGGLGRRGCWGWVGGWGAAQKAVQEKQCRWVRCLLLVTPTCPSAQLPTTRESDSNVFALVPSLQAGYERQVAAAGASEREARQRAAAAAEETEHVRSQLARAEARVAEQELAMQRMVSQFEGALATLQQLEAQYDGLAADAGAADRLRAARIEELEHEAAGLRASRAALQAERDGAAAAAAAAEAAASEAKQQYHRAMMDAAELTEALAGARAEAAAAASRAKVAEEELAGARAATAQTQAALEREVGAHARTQGLLEASRLHQDAAAHDAREQEALAAQLREAAAVLEAERNDCAKAAEAAEAKVRHMAGQVCRRLAEWHEYKQTEVHRGCALWVREGAQVHVHQSPNAPPCIPLSQLAAASRRGARRTAGLPDRAGGPAAGSAAGCSRGRAGSPLGACPRGSAGRARHAAASAGPGQPPACCRAPRDGGDARAVLPAAAKQQRRRPTWGRGPGSSAHGARHGRQRRARLAGLCTKRAQQQQRLWRPGPWTSRAAGWCCWRARGLHTRCRVASRQHWARPSPALCQQPAREAGDAAGIPTGQLWQRSCQHSLPAAAACAHRHAGRQAVLFPEGS